MTDTTKHSEGAIRAGDQVCELVFGSDSDDWPKDNITEIIDRETKCTKCKELVERLTEERQRSDRLFGAIVFYHTTMDKELGDHDEEVKKATRILNTKVSEYCLWLKARPDLPALSTPKKEGATDV